MQRRAWLGVVAVGMVATWGCVEGCVSDESTAAQDGNDSGADSGGETSTADAGGEAGDDSGTVYNDMGTASAWETFDLTILDPTASGYTTAGFDGRYLYILPGDHTAAHPELRFDTQGKLNDAAGAWKVFSAQTNFPSSPYGYAGAAFDGTDLIAGPYQGLGSSDNAVAMKIDPTAPFDQPSGWTPFNLEAADGGNLAGATTFNGAAFDGNYVYFVPYRNSVVARFNSHGSFTNAPNWTASNLMSITDAGTEATQFSGGVFDGHYLYLVPSGFSTAVRFDTTGGFQDGSMWKNFDLLSSGVIGTAAANFGGGVFDGHYIYFVPNQSLAIVRLDTTGTFDDPGAWTSYTPPSLSGVTGFAGGVFDGRYVYFAPESNTPAANPPDGSLVVRYDTTAGFGSPNSWQTFTTTTLDGNAKGFVGCAFDGQYVYFIPVAHSILVRFKAKSPASMPAAYKGSFF